MSRTLPNNPRAVQIVGYAPLNLRDATRYVLDELPRAGYELGRGDEEAGEVESAFRGSGWDGGIRVAEINACDTVTEWVIVAIQH